MRDFNFKDPTWSITNTDLWSRIESTLGIVCACAPLLGPVLSHVSHLTKAIVSPRRVSRRHSPRGENSGARLIKGYEDTYPLTVPKTSTIIESGTSVKGSNVYDDHEHGGQLGWIQARRDWQVRHA